MDVGTGNLSESGARVQLAKRDMKRMLELLPELIAVQTPADFTAWTNGALQTLLPHEMMIAGIATIESPEVQIQKVIVQNWPLSYFEPLKKKGGGFHSPIMARWHRCNVPQLYDPAVVDDVGHGVWRDVFNDYGLGNIAANGIRDFGGRSTSYFNFSRIPEPLTSRHGDLLNLLTPHMHVALLRALHMVAPYQSQPAEAIHLTEREQVILYWIQEGKTNWEIAKICDRSQHTIKNQVETLFRKLQVVNRAQAGRRAALLQLPLGRPPP